MKRTFITITIVLLMITAANADSTTELYRSGYWSTFYTARNAQGKPMCGTSADWTFTGGDKGWLAMKWTNETGLFVHIQKLSWSFAPGLKDIPLAISLDNGYREATGFSIKGSLTGKPILEIDVPEDNVIGFLEDFANAKQMTINFKEGNEPDWVANMKGSRGALKAFLGCINKITTSSSVGPQATSPVKPRATAPVGPQATSPVAPSSQPVNAKKKDDGSI